MAITQAAKTILSDILGNQVQEFLGGADALFTTILMDLTSQVGEGQDETTIPKIGGLAVQAVVETSTDVVVGTTMTVDGDTLELSSFKQVPLYIGEKESIESAVNLKASFLAIAPKLYVEDVENTCYTALEAGNVTDNFNSGVLNSFTIANIGSAKKIMDKKGISKEGRYLDVNAEGMEILAATTEFQDGSKSLSDKALKEGVVSRVKGFNVIQYDGSSASDTKVLCFHKDAACFAHQKDMEYIEEKQSTKARTFHALRGKYGVKLLDAGERCLTITMAV